MAVPVHVLERIEKLREEITRLRAAQHEEDQSLVSPEALDSLKRELALLEEEFPESITPESPTQTIAGTILPELQKTIHEVPQWSLNDAFDEGDIKAFDERVRRALQKAGDDTPPTYSCELKIDGLHILLTYEKGKLVLAATRGDGVVGENVTHTVRTIGDVPSTLTRPVDLIVEGEVYMSKRGFENLNKTRAKNGEPLFANPRNVSAGSVRQLDSSVAASRPLGAFLYDLERLSEPFPPTQGEELMYLKELGLTVNPFSVHADTVEEIVDYWKIWQGRERERLDYLIDGIVIKVESRRQQELLGHTGKGPRYAIAFKFAPEQVTTVVEDISLQLGRTGKLTPVAHLRSAQVGGTTVSRASLHNEDYITSRDIRIGDTVILQKAGDIIPEVVEVLKNLRPKNAKKWKFPTHSELCGGNGWIERVPGEAAHRCAVRGSDAEQELKLAHFVSKSALNIDGFAGKTIRLLMDHGLVSSYDDIFTLKYDELIKLPGFKEKSARNLLESIEKARRVPLNRFLIGLSIDHVGEETAALLSERFHTLISLSQADEEELTEVQGIGDIVAKSVAVWFRNQKNKELLKRLQQYITVEKVDGPRKSGQLKDEVVVVTGTLPTLSRDEAKMLIKNAGGVVSGMVSSKTTLLLAGENPGSKYEKAEELGIEIISEKDLRRRLGL